MLSGLLSLGVDAEATLTEATPAPAATAAAGISKQYSLHELGVDYQMSMSKGTLLGVPFGIAADLVPTAGSLLLKYRVAEHVPPGQAQLSIRLNGIQVGTVQLVAQDAGRTLQQVLPLPAEALAGFNHLELELKSDTIQQCHAGQPAAAWLEISSASQIRFSAQPVALDNDLSLWPLPFFDERTVDPLRLKLAFAGSPDPAKQRSAGILASWLGIQAGYRGTDLSAGDVDQPEDQNTIALVTADHLPAGVDPADVDGPKIEIRDLPGGHGHKLLLIMGRDDAQLQAAVLALVQGKPMHGASFRVTGSAVPPPRQPYDAPAWLDMNGPVRLRELGMDGDGVVKGPFPPSTELSLSLPPDLYATDRTRLPLNLRYAITAPAHRHGWLLQVMVNGHPAAELPLASPASSVGTPVPTAFHQHRVMLPLADFAGRSVLRFNFDFRQQPGCVSTAASQAKARIAPDSTLDISGWQHYLVMPDLAAFANSGFPYSRLADLQDTAVVLPDGVAWESLATAFNLLARIGSATGYPAYRVQFTDAAHVADHAHQDLLLLGSADDQPLFEQWSTLLPTYPGAATLSGYIQRWLILHVPARWRHERRPDLASTAGQLFDGSRYEALLMGFQSPLDHAHSVVALEGLHPGGVKPLLDALRDPVQLARVQGSVAVLERGRVRSFVGLQSYSVGSLSRISRWALDLSSRPWLLAAWMLLWTGLVALKLSHILRGVARRRLNEREHDD
ncbi:cellulose biosynthesis cyclic di-GMP-binding regulatory protein BcsB [Frateuria aurantia]